MFIVVQCLKRNTMQRCARRLFAANPLPFGRLNHVAIAVPLSKKLTEAAAMYKTLFNAKVSEPKEIPEHGVVTVFVELPNSKLELLHPLGDKSPIAPFLEKNPAGGMHHMCVEVENIANSIAACKANGIRTIGDKPKIGAHNKPVIFLHPKDCGGVLVEMEQSVTRTTTMTKRQTGTGGGWVKNAHNKWILVTWGWGVGVGESDRGVYFGGEGCVRVCGRGVCVRVCGGRPPLGFFSDD